MTQRVDRMVKMVPKRGEKGETQETKPKKQTMVRNGHERRGKGQNGENEGYGGTSKTGQKRPTMVQK
jgi:hypothetical protein